MKGMVIVMDNKNYMEEEGNIDKENYIEQDNYIGQENYEEQEDYIERARWSPKRTATRIGLALAVMAATVTLFQVVVTLLCKNYSPGIFASDWFGWALVAVSMYGIGLPIFFLLTKSIPNGIRKPVVKLKVHQFIIIFFIAAAAMYITNIFSVLLNFILMLFKGSEIMNPIMDVILDGNMLITFLYTAIGAPIVEELIFRKLMLDKLRRFGDLTAILTTGIAFGLFHMNLSQIFYATALGIIFAYVAIRTNTIRYSIILHIIINTIGATVAPLALINQNLKMLVLLGLWVIASTIVGIIFFIIFVLVKRKVVLEKGIEFVPKKSVFLLNPGSLIFVGICLVSVIMVIIA